MSENTRQTTKVENSFKNGFSGMFRDIFVRTWCAALSSVVCLRALSGKNSASTQSHDFQKETFRM
jgi:hypothetical protein